MITSHYQHQNKKISQQQPHTHAHQAILQQQFTANYTQLHHYEQPRQHQQQEQTRIMAHSGQTLHTTNFNTYHNIPLSSSGKK